MDYIWTPWRYRYIAEAGKGTGCIFCDLPAAHRDEETLIILRGAKNYIILNHGVRAGVVETGIFTHRAIFDWPVPAAGDW
jgi:hypothetical protein